MDTEDVQEHLERFRRMGIHEVLPAMNDMMRKLDDEIYGLQTTPTPLPDPPLDSSGLYPL
jgi:hypothetical protein